MLKILVQYWGNVKHSYTNTMVETLNDCMVSKLVGLTDLKHQDMSKKACSNEIGIFDEVLLMILMDLMKFVYQWKFCLKVTNLTKFHQKP